MKVTLKDVEKIAKLSRLSFNEEEKKEFLHQFVGVLDHVSAINSIDTEGVAPCSNVFELYNVMREDISKPAMDTELLMRTAPESEDGAYLVPKVVV